MPIWEWRIMLKVERVAAAYGDVQALWDVSLEVDLGETVVLIGPNGAGKTTLMRTIAGLHPRIQGSISFDGTPIHNQAAHRIAEQGIILVPEGRHLFGGLTVLENLELGAYMPRARAERAKTMQKVFEIFPYLAQVQARRANSLSGGQQQMLAIGRALMGLPRLLMLDEPSLGLAPLVVANIFEVISAVNAQGVTVFLVEQNARQALELAQRAYIIEQGRIVGSGTGKQLLNDDSVRAAYLGYETASQGAV